MHCINCAKDAVWIFKASGVRETPYCNPHLPSAYRGTKNVTPVEALPETVVEPKPKRAKKAVVTVDLPESVFESPAGEDTVLLETAENEGFAQA
jgi:hypothetical protein